MRTGLRVAIAVFLAGLLLVSGIRLATSSDAASPSFRFSAAGDWGSWSGFAEGLRQLKNTSSDFVLALGDLSYGGDTEQGWCQEFKRSFDNVAIVAGNHDSGAPPLGEGNINLFAQYCPFTIDASLVGEYGKQYYFDFPKGAPLVRFILISPDIDFVVDGGEHYKYNVGTARYNWTRDVIDSARTSHIPWVIVGMHKNCIGAGEHACETGPDILNLLLDRKVDLILNAHTHNYERSKQLALNTDTCTGMKLHSYNGNCVVNDGSSGQYIRGSGSVVVIAGTGGRDIDAFNINDPYAQYFAAWKGNETPGAGKGVATFDVSADEISMHTTFNGTFSDSFKIMTGGSGLFAKVLSVLPIAAPIAIGLIGLGVGGIIVLRNKRREGKARDSKP